MKITSYKKKDGRTYYSFQVYLNVDSATGKQKQTTRRGFTSRKEAQIAAANLINGQNTKKLKYTTFYDVYESWYAQHKNTVKESTQKFITTLFTKHILPTLGDIKIDKIDLNLIQNTVNEWAEESGQYKTLKAYTSNVLKHAMRLELINKNPADLVVLPKAEKKQKSDNYMDKDELTRFLDCAYKHLSQMWFTFFWLLIYTGLRKGEALALEWRDIDFNASTLKVDKALTFTSNGVKLDTPKTTASNRVISLDSDTISLLKMWKDAQGESVIIFNNTKNSYVTFSQPGRQLTKLIRLCKLKTISTHGLRHTHCCLLFEAGANISQVQQRLGHTDIKTTMDIYNHVTKAKERETALIFSEYLSQNLSQFTYDTDKING